MKQEEIYHYVERYLDALDCDIIAQGSNYITSRLSLEADKDITNRPYYWMFVERTGAEPQTQTLTFRFDIGEENNEDIKGEGLQLGCWRLHQIFQSAKKHGQYVRLYEETPYISQAQGLVPWLLVNYKISFISDQKKDLYYPLGFNLLTGQIIAYFDQVISSFSLSPKIPDYHFTLRPIFSIRSAIQRIEDHIYQLLEKEDNSWAEEAHRRIDEEVELIHSFFAKDEEQKAAIQRRTEEVEHYRPKIEVNAINVGIVYLHSKP